MPDDDYYAILQVDPRAEPEVIEAAYRRLARKYHPDLTGGDPAAAERMKQINAAYETLRSPERRAAYDRARRRALGDDGRRGQGRHSAASTPSAISPIAALLVQMVILSIVSTIVFRFIHHPIVLVLVLVGAVYVLWKYSSARS